MFLTWKFLHIVGVVGFVAAHGTSASVALRLRRERDRIAIATLLGLSRSTRPLMYLSLLLIIVSGAVASSELGVWAMPWIWWSIVLLVAMTAAAMVLAVPYYGSIRRMLSADPPVTEEGLDRVLSSARPIVITVVETVGVLLIIWLMVAKPT